MFTVRPYLLSALLMGAAVLVPASGAQAGPKAARGQRSAPVSDSAMTDGQSLGVAEAASSGEILLATTAASRVRTEPVQQLARATINDHTDAIQAAHAVGDRLNLRAAQSAASNEIRKEADEATSHLENATAPSIDRTYVEGSIRLHQKVLNTIDEAVLRTHSEEVKALMGGVRARVTHELDTARSVLASLHTLA